MAKLILKGATVALMFTVAACSNKPKVADVPPPAPAPVEQNTQPAPPPVQQGAVPGSRADFLAQAGSDTVYFGTDLHDLDGEATATLARQAEWLKRYPNVTVTLEGHCDERGTREYNLALGDRRANSAKNYLVSQGVDAGRISTISYGKERPVATGSDEASWAQNRRAVTVVPQ